MARYGNNLSHVSWDGVPCLRGAWQGVVQEKSGKSSIIHVFWCAKGWYRSAPPSHLRACWMNSFAAKGSTIHLLDSTLKRTGAQSTRKSSNFGGRLFGRQVNQL